MKKLLSILMALAMIASLSTTAFAADTWENGEGETDTFSSDVNATYEQETVDVYKVVVEWGELNFTYTDTPVIWDTTTYKWVEDTESDVVTGWSVDDKGGDIITVSNCSSLPVNVEFEVTEVNYDLEYSFSDNDFVMDAATAGVDDANGTATVVEVTVSLEGIPGEGAKGTNSANITVVVSAVEAA